MKFTKLVSSTLATATILSILAPAAISQAATAEGDAAGNNGTALPQTDKTVAGISFGDTTDNGNKGYLRLQSVPHVLDFGNHKTLDTSKMTFTADGKNAGLNSNDQYASYLGNPNNDTANKTATLNTTDTNLAAVKGTAWATVVDKQETRKAGAVGSANNTSANGDWTLKVASDGALMGKNGSTIANATLAFSNGKAATTNEVHDLTGEDQDANYVGALATAPVADFSDSFALNLAAGSEAQVAHAVTDEGAGANVFGWTPSNISLIMPTATTAVDNTTYVANLTWTLSTGITA